MGQVAGTAAHLAIERGITPQEVPYPQLRERLAAQKVELAGKENPAEAPRNKKLSVPISCDKSDSSLFSESGRLPMVFEGRRSKGDGTICSFASTTIWHLVLSFF